MKIPFCEFTGDATSTWDGPRKKLCEHAGFEHCTLHQKPLGELDGWRVCCAECTTPVQVLDISGGSDGQP